MTETDFSKLGQLFYQEVGRAEASGSLFHQLLQDSCKAYQDHFIRPGLVTEGIRQMYYPGQSETSYCLVSLVTQRERPEISGLSLTGATADFPALLQNLRGTLEAEFSGMELVEVINLLALSPENAENVRGKKHALVRNLGLYFSLGREYHGQTQSPTPIQNQRLQQVRLEKQFYKKIILPRYKPSTLEESTLDSATLHLLAQAERLTVQHEFYAAADIDRTLLRERCQVIQPKPGDYHWEYQFQVTNNQSIPLESLPHLERLFALIQPDFGPHSFQRRSIINPEHQNTGREEL